MRHATRWLLLLAGHASVLLGLIGVFVPGLPTTPFLLLAAACYVRSSERHYRWLIGNPLFGRAIEDYQRTRAIRPRTKAVALTVMWASLAFSTWRASNPYLDGFILIAGVVLTLLILRIPTLRQEVERVPES